MVEKLCQALPQEEVEVDFHHYEGKMIMFSSNICY